MKKFISFAVFALMLAATTFTLTACGDDDENNINPSAIIGIWQVSEYHLLIKHGDEVMKQVDLIDPSPYECDYWRYQFNEKGGRQYLSASSYDDFDIWTLNKGLLLIQWDEEYAEDEDDFDVWHITLNGNDEMVLSLGTDVAGTMKYADHWAENAFPPSYPRPDYLHETIKMVRVANDK